jgi:hypothetical protein
MDLKDIYAYIIIIPFLVGVKKYKFFNTGLKFLFWFVVYGVVNEIVSDIFAHYKMYNTMPRRYLYTFITFPLLGMFYHYSLEGFFRKPWLLFIVILYEVGFLINVIFLKSMQQYPANESAISVIIVVFFSILYFHKIMVEARISKLISDPMIWLNTALLIYFSGSLFFHVMFNVLFEYSREFGRLTNLYFGISNIVFYSLVTVGFLMVKKKSLE